jgi:hypothetical protein
MNVYVPVPITASNLVSSTLFETAPALYPTGAPFALGAYTAVAGAFGEIKIYKNILADDGTHAPTVSPTYWEYSSSTYEIFSSFVTYPLDYRVIDPATHKVKQSVVSNNYNRPFDPVANPSWISLGKAATYVEPLLWVAATSYAVGDIRRDQITAPSPADPGVLEVVEESIFRCIAAHTSGVTSPISEEPGDGGGVNWDAARDYPRPYVIGRTYNTGHIVIDEAGTAWYSNQDGNRAPFDNAPAWVDVGTSNYWAAFNPTISTQAKASNSLTFVVSPGPIDGIFFLNTDVDQIDVEIRDGVGGAVIYTASSLAASGLIGDWWEYFHADFAYTTRQVRLVNLPPSATPYITITLTGASIAVGDLIFGRGQDLGTTLVGLQVGIKDFSLIKEDETFGTTEFTKRYNRKRMDARQWLLRTEFNRIFKLLSALPATPCVWVAAVDDELDEGLTLKAWYKDFVTEIAGETEIYCNLKLEGTI